MQSYFNWAQLGDQTVSVPGSSASTTLVQRSYPLATVEVFDAGTVNVSTIFSDNSSTPLANPFTANADGSFEFYAANGRYDIVLSGAGIAAPFTIQDVLLNDTAGAGITSINALTDPAQFLVAGTAGTDFAITSSVATHTFDLPTASATNRGALSSTDWSTFNSKESALTFSSPLSRTVNTVSLSTVPVASGGTASTTATTAFNTLAPTTTKGDIIAHNGTNNIRLGVGTDGFALVAASGQPSGLNYAAVPAVPVTVAQGGTGLTTLTGVPYGTGTAALTPVVASSQLQVFRRTPNVVGTTYSFGPVPYVVSSDFDFPAQQPGGSLTGGVGASITLTPVPLGVNGADTGHYVYLSAGTGAAEAVLITGGSAVSGASSGTLTFTPANNHSGAWTVTSATGGVQEAISYLPSGDNQVIIPQGTTTLNANVSFGGKTSAIIVLSNGLTLAGSGTLPAVGSQTYILDYRTSGASEKYYLPIFAQTQTVTVGNTVTETTLVGTGQGSATLPANFFFVGKTIRCKMLGFHSSTGGPTVTFRFKLGGTTVATATGASGNGTNDGFMVEVYITCRSIGATGTIFAQGQYAELHSGGLVDGLTPTATTTVDTTGTLAVNITIEWGTAVAGNTASATNFTIENIV